MDRIDLSDKQIDGLNQLSQALENIYRDLDISKLNAPMNADVEKQKLRAAHENNEPYDPQFEYEIFPPEKTKPLYQFMQQLKPYSNRFHEILYRDASHKLRQIVSVTHHDPARITSLTISRHGLPTKRLVDRSLKYLRDIPLETETATISSETAAQTMTDTLQALGIDDWLVITPSVMSANMAVRSVEKKILVKQGSRFSEHAMQRLLVHEIGTHVFRYINGEQQPLHFLRLGLNDYMKTEEGMATHHEAAYQLRNNKTGRRYAIRVLAAYYGLNHGFYNVFQRVIDYTDFDDAYDIVSRCKRGFTDTSQFGAHVKDKIYFEGFLTVSHHLKQYPQDYDLLMSGKVSLGMLPLLRRLKHTDLLRSPHYLPAMIDLSA